MKTLRFYLSLYRIYRVTRSPLGAVRELVRPTEF